MRSRSRVSPIVRLPLLSPRLRRRWSDLPSPTLDAQTANANGDVASASTTAGVSALACVADGVFVSGDDAGTLTMWSASTGHDAIALDRGAAVARAHDACISSICVVADKSRFVTAGADARVRVWDTERAMRASGSDALLSAPDARAVNAAAAHPTDANLLATAGDDGTARVWDLRVGAKSSVRERAGPNVRGGVGRAYALAWADARLGEALAVGYESGAIAVLETQETLSLATRGVVEAHADAVRGLAWGGPTGLCLASCGDDGAVATHAGELPVTKNTSRTETRTRGASRFGTAPATEPRDW